MKRKITITTVFLGMFLIFASCTKEGPQGIAGTNGTNGTDGTAGCIECHDNSQLIVTKSLQYEKSGHGMGVNSERNDVDCAPCHTSQGFLEVIETGAMATAAPIANPTQQNCYTCHNIHDSYSPDDWALTQTEPVTFWMNDVVSDQGKANQCIGCHQGRELSPYPDLTAPTAIVTVTSSRYGPHHGPQGMLFAGTGGMEIAGPTSYINSAHTTQLANSCVDCHMQEAYGTQAGGHQMGMTYAYHGAAAVWTASCVACHTDADAVHAKVEAAQEEITLLHDSLGAILQTKGFLTSSNSVVTGDYTNLEAATIYNFKYIEEDKSKGIHNYKYARALMMNSIDAAK